ncbi:MAG: hypothetical protein HC836_10710 [Richelia sp. RM2_1_2]|nr:hypothetical protein [Richelia sp. RM2_1_2]
MATLPTIAQKTKKTQAGRNLQTWLDRGSLFSDAEDVCTDTTDYELPTRTEDPKKSKWSTWSLFYAHEIKIELIDVPDMITRVDRNDTIKSYLHDSGLKERADWWFDDDNNCIYLRDDYFTLVWKMTNTKQFEENVKCIVSAKSK